MFDSLDVQAVPGDGVLHRNDHCLVLVTGSPADGQSKALSEWALGEPGKPLPPVGGVAAIGWDKDTFYIHANGPVQVVVESGSATFELNLEPAEFLSTLAVHTVKTVACRHIDFLSEEADPSTTLTEGTLSASGFIARLQPSLPVNNEPISDGERLANAAPIPDPSEPTPSANTDPSEPTPSVSADAPPVPPGPLTAEAPPLPETPPHPRTKQAANDSAASNPVLSDIYVLGVVCPRCSNYNHPDAQYCYVDGHRLVETRVLQNVQRPTLGHLRLSHNGEHVQLLKSIVLGRAPYVSPLVENGTAASISLEDPTMSLSRSHAIVELRDWDVFLRDDGSQNGTWLVAPNGSRRRIGAGEEILLAEETTFTLGPTKVTFFPASLKR